MSDLGQEAIQLILAYAKTWDLLSAYDEGQLELPQQGKKTRPKLNYQTALSVIKSFVISIENCRWKSLTHGLFQLPMAA